MPIPNQSSAFAIAQDFHQARRRAALQEIIARLTGESVSLLSYDEVRKKLRAHAGHRKTLEDIPIASIIGSVGRYSDFTRDFLPRQESDAERWARVKIAFSDLKGLPPIEVYKIGEAYFVEDGNHRVSVARNLGVLYIHAYVTEVKTRVPINPDFKPDDLIVKSEYADFLEETRLDEFKPGASLEVTIPGQYDRLREHIQVHRYYMGLERKSEIPYTEAVAHWYDTVYAPIIGIIRKNDLLRRFPKRTETDLYLWLAEHRADLEKEVGWEIEPEAAAKHLADQPTAPLEKMAYHLSEKILGNVLPVELEAGPPPGFWRQEIIAGRNDDRLFLDILVLIDGKTNGWIAMDQAIGIARRERSHLHGLHVVKAEQKKNQTKVQGIQQEFEQRCRAAGVTGDFQVASDQISDLVCSRSRWADLVVLNLAFPPAPRPMARLSSSISNLIRRCSAPILFVPGKVVEVNSVMLAFDASPKAEEALYVAAYLASQWKLPLTVMTIYSRAQVAPESSLRARVYLEEHGIEAGYEITRGPAGQSILLAAETHQSQLILMGGYGASPLREVFKGSTVDEVLRSSSRPVLVCR